MRTQTTEIDIKWLNLRDEFRISPPLWDNNSVIVVRRCVDSMFLYDFHFLCFLGTSITGSISCISNGAGAGIISNTNK